MSRQTTARLAAAADYQSGRDCWTPAEGRACDKLTDLVCMLLGTVSVSKPLNNLEFESSGSPTSKIARIQ